MSTISLRLASRFFVLFVASHSVTAEWHKKTNEYFQGSFYDNGLFNSPEDGGPDELPDAVLGAIYFITNDPRGNSVIATSIVQDGRLGFSRSFDTGGYGGYAFSPANTSGVPDALGSQNALVVHEDVLFVVNPGSNTVSIFVIDHTVPTNLLLANTFHSGGEFPSSLAFSKKLQMLCVLNGGAINGVQCFSFLRDNNSGLPSVVRLPDVAKSLGQPFVTPPNAVDSVPDLVFTPDSSQLLVAGRRNANSGMPGFILSFHIEKGSIGNAVRNVPPGSVGPFGIGFVPGTGRETDLVLVFTDPGANGYGLARVKGTGVIEQSRITIIPGQIATCWTAFSARSGHLFTSDTIKNVVTESSLNLDTLAGTIVNQYEVPGALDEVVVSLKDSDILYVLTPGRPGIRVMSLAVPARAQTIQHYSPRIESLRYALNSGIVGIAVYLL